MSKQPVVPEDGLVHLETDHHFQMAFALVCGLWAWVGSPPEVGSSTRELAEMNFSVFDNKFVTRDLRRVTCLACLAARS